MDKQMYKEMLAESIELVGQTDKEINRLQILIAENADKEAKLKKMIYDHPNDMELGSLVRGIYLSKGSKGHEGSE